MHNYTGRLEVRDTQEVGRILQQAREEARLSRQELANAVGLTLNRYAQLEVGYVTRTAGSERRPTRLDRDKLLRVCNALGISADTADKLLTLSGYPPLDRSREIVYLHELAAADRQKILDQVERYRRRQPPSR